MYKPPFSLTNKIVQKVDNIATKVEKITSYNSLKRMPILRRNNHIKSIFSSLAIEANSLSLENVKDVISGKNVIGPIKEIQEVKNAYDVYSNFDKFDYLNQEDLKKAHQILMNNIISDNGIYRNHAEGVIDGTNVIFVAPPAKMVLKLMDDLFCWLNEDDETHLLIKSCVFHYEFVFIHPFSDGNGRTARFWQNLILTKWREVFEYIPIESLIYQYQNDYYNTIDYCNKKGESTKFIEFMLDMIDKTLDDVLDKIDKDAKNISDQVNDLLTFMEPDTPYSGVKLMEMLHIKSKETLRNSYLNPAIENGLVKMTLPDKPKSKNQKYIK